ncbi:hypothetical protein [uncultured Paludibaculum sp.]|uniref:hypothetical protein n=1 Tax=uncultured Paludibaculum sp. TaxID=1765020 RepID=UPI002AAB92CF|nr:hypothetical protein [uncultured Paludibaculum sp.]
MTAKLLLSFCLAFSLYGQCSAPTSKLGTSFTCKAQHNRVIDGIKAYLADRVKGGMILAEKRKLTASNKTETVTVWLLLETEGETKLRVEVRPVDSAPLLGESADTARALRLFLTRALQ